MLSRSTEDLQLVMDKLRTIIENKQTINVTIDTNTSGHFHDALLLSKLIIDKANTLIEQKTIDEVADDVAEMNFDYYSESEDLTYCLFDAILKDEVKVGE